jgi:hypothetical protein
MGTRSLTLVKDGKATILIMYQQYDGYPSGVGAEYKKLFQGWRLCNGFGGTESTETKWSNGLQCFAATLVAKTKSKIGNVYLYPTSAKDCGQQYVYTFSEKESRLWLRLTTSDPKHVLYNGFLDDFDPTKEYDDEE